MNELTFLLLAILVLFVLWVRYWPLDRDIWHVDPADIDDTEMVGLRISGPEAPRYPSDAETVLSTFWDIARAEPRTRLLEGDLDEGMITIVARSKVIGFPDVITAKAVFDETQTKLSVVSRARFKWLGRGKNPERLDRWLQDMRLRLGQR